jgi:hypothetical protein
MKKFFYIAVLFLITTSASLFMIFESGAYFQTYYGLGSWKPFYLATILEVFLISLSIIKYGETWFRWLQNLIMICIFVVIVVSSGLSSVQHVFTALHTVEKEAKIEQARKDKLASLEKDADYFKERAKSEFTADRYTQNKNVAFDQYIKSIEESGDSNSEAKLALINIVLLILVRLLIQSGNLVCARSIGVVYRDDHIDKVKAKIDDVETGGIKCKRNKENKLYEITFDGKVLASASTARGAWKNYKEFAP